MKMRQYYVYNENGYYMECGTHNVNTYELKLKGLKKYFKKGYTIEIETGNVVDTWGMTEKEVAMLNQ